MGLFSRFKSSWLNPFYNDGGESTLASPSSELVHALVGLPAAAGKVVTKETAIRVSAFLGGVKMLANDLAKMPLILRETTMQKGSDGRSYQRTQPAIDEPLYSILKDCPNQWQTSYQMRWFLASQLIMSSNCYCQKITDQAGDVAALIPLNAWHMTPHWDYTTTPPTLKYRYNNMGMGGMIEFTQDQIWHVSALNLEGFGLEGSPTIILAKEALSLLMAAEEVAGRNFANGLGMGGFISFPNMDDAPDEKEAQNIVDRLRKDFSGSQNAGKFTLIPGGGKWEKMTFNAQESQVLESRKWSEQEVVRLLGGAPLMVKMGLGEQNSTYASSSAFLDEYFNTSLLPFTTAIEQSITRDLIPKKQWGKLYAKHSADIILRGSPKERAQTNQVLITSWQMSPNEARLLEDRDAIEGGDFLSGPANGAIYNPVTGEFFIPGQKVPDPDDPDDANEEEGSGEPNEAGADTAGDGDGNIEPPFKHPAPPKPVKQPVKKAPAKPSKAKARLHALANSMAERVIRKESKGKSDAKFVADVLNISMAQAEQYVAQRKDMTDEQAREALVALAVGDNNE
jgi:HK97 family phage portal protein